MQILEIVLYSPDGKRRPLALRPGKVNIVTGGSATGKSSLIDIVSYCLGQSKCTIAEGVVLDCVAWYGVRLQLPSTQVFIARVSPTHKYQQTNTIYFEQGDKVESPLAISAANTSLEALTDSLTRLVGISPNLHQPPIGQTRDPLAANIHHALIYCFQEQGEVATKHILFHRQSEDFMTQTIKDTLPYFLGAIREDQLALEQDLSRAKRELRLIQQRDREIQAIQGQGLSKANSLLAEAAQVGIASSDEQPASINEFRKVLTKIAEWSPEQIAFPGSDRLVQLQEEMRKIEEGIREKADSIRTAKVFAEEAEGYTSEAKRQGKRLESIKLFDLASPNAETCPLCTQELTVPVPKAEAMKRALGQIHQNLEATLREQPRLREYLEKLEKEKEGLRKQYEDKRLAVNALTKEHTAARNARDLNSRRAKIVGRISLWLESVQQDFEDVRLKKELAAARKKVEGLEVKLSGVEKDERLNSILNRLGIQMTELSNKMTLEHGRNPVRLDLKNLTVVVDRKDRPMPLQRLGSGENYVGYHLITHFVLHQHFVAENRPVPRFLFIDQPTQVYYPDERDEEFRGGIEAVKNEDREKVRNMFSLILDVTARLSPGLQVIVMDHADLKDAAFQDAVIARWRDGDALVPRDWIKKS